MEEADKKSYAKHGVSERPGLEETVKPKLLNVLTWDCEIRLLILDIWFLQYLRKLRF